MICHFQVILLVFDITNSASFTRLTDWVKKALALVVGKPPLVALVANKCALQRLHGTEQFAPYVVSAQ